MGSRLKLVSAAIITVLLLIVFLIYLKRRSHYLAEAKKCTAQISSGPSPSPHKNGFVGTTKCCDAVRGKALEQVCKLDNQGSKSLTKDPQSAGCSCMDFFYCKLVIASALSSNHVPEATEMVISVQEHMPNTRLIMYSLGLTGEETALLKSYCNVELRVFEFNKYPGLSYAKHNLRKFGWKPLIVKEIADEYDVVLWLDTSGRLTGPIGENTFKYLQSMPTFLAGPWEGSSCVNPNDPIVAYTHDNMLRYIFPNKSTDLVALRKELRMLGHIQATVWLVWLNEDMKKKLLKNWVDCAFHEECMAPRDAVIDCNPIKYWFVSQFSPEGQYIDCHRYDQSALDMILYREFGLSVAKKICHEFVFNLFLIVRDSRIDEKIHIFLAFVIAVIVFIIFINWYCS